MKRADYLIEIGLEELPPKPMPGLISAFAENVKSELEKAQLAFASVESFATPRRLALRVQDLAGEQPVQAIEKRGPSVSAAFDEHGEPTKAAAGFARSCGVDDVAALDRIQTDKGEWLVYRDEKPGESLGALLPGILERALDAVPVERAMRWGAVQKAFVRPVHWIVSLYGDEVMPVSLYGATAGRESQGHRFMSNGVVSINAPGDYEAALESAHVIASFEKRRSIIAAQLEQMAGEQGAEIVIDPALLDEVTALVEWPVTLCGKFDESFLRVPEEALVSAMKSHQRYFHMVDAEGRLLPRFVTIANIESADPEVVVAGNERVITPRLTDAAFFYEQDRKTSLEAKTERLKQVVFQSKLGTYHDKATRIAALCAEVETLLGTETGAPRAGLLCKADLVTDMVDEFPDLQGIMGDYYARHDGEPEAVCTAIGEHYRPTQSGGDIPGSLAGQIVAIADKLDTLTGLFGIGQPPTGSRDPFALRRQSLGVLRILMEAELDLDLFDLLERACKLHGADFDAAGLKDYMIERLAVYYQDRGIQGDTFDAAMGSEFEGLVLPTFDRRVRAIQAFRSRPEASSLAAANKRIANLLSKVEGETPSAVDPSMFAHDAEQALFDAVNEKARTLETIEGFEQKLGALSTLQTVVDRYFDDVLVMDNDDAVRNNRLATLASMRQLFLQIADVSMLQL